MQAAAILCSYKRPQNVNRILTVLLASNRFGKIYLCNNNPENKTHDLLQGLKDNRLEIVEQAKPTGKVLSLWAICRNDPSEFFFNPDDDMFPTVGQVHYLMDRLAEDPERVHGTEGQIVVGNRHFNIASKLGNKILPVDILNCVYAFTKNHVRRFWYILDLLGISNDIEKLDELGRKGDDIILSVCSAVPAIIHDLAIKRCTSSDSSIAAWQSSGFFEFRANLLEAYKTMGTHKKWALQEMFHENFKGCLIGEAKDSEELIFTGVGTNSSALKNLILMP